MIKGEFATMGFVSYLQKPAATQNATLIDILLDGGGVLYCKTTVPQTLLVNVLPSPPFSFKTII